MPKRIAPENENSTNKERISAMVKESVDALFTAGAGPFVSKHQFAAEDMEARIRAIDWFSRCGNLDDDFDLTMEIERVKSWPQAMKAMRSRAWEDATLEARNQLTMQLSETHRDRANQWNKVTAVMKRSVMNALTTKILEPFRKTHDLDMKLVHSVQWNVLALLMENAYIDCDHGSFFFHELLTVYERGHLPCGWIGKWPKGKLVVF